jgi:hypothetical protein
MPIKGAIDEAMEEIRDSDKKSAPESQMIGDAFAGMEHLGRMFQKCSALLGAWQQDASEGNDIVKRWDNELTSAITVSEAPEARTSSGRPSDRR